MLCCLHCRVALLGAMWSVLRASAELAFEQDKEIKAAEHLRQASVHAHTQVYSSFVFDCLTSTQAAIAVRLCISISISQQSGLCCMVICLTLTLHAGVCAGIWQCPGEPNSQEQQGTLQDWSKVIELAYKQGLSTRYRTAEYEAGTASAWIAAT